MITVFVDGLANGPFKTQLCVQNHPASLDERTLLAVILAVCSGGKWWEVISA